MATDPIFTGTVATAAALLTTADLSLTAPSVAATVLTANATNGSKIEAITIAGVGTTVAGAVNIFTHDGTTYHLFDTILVTAVTPSATVAPFFLTRPYVNFWLPKATPTWTLRASQTIAGNASLLKITVMYGDF